MRVASTGSKRYADALMSGGRIASFWSSVSAYSVRTLSVSSITSDRLAAYALIAYQTAYFKAHHPAAFMAANLSLVMDDTDKVRTLYADTLDQKLAILPPDINASAYRFEPVDATRIRYGLG